MYDYKDKARNVKLSNKYMLAKTLSMFDYEGLPDSIPEQELERILQEKGFAFIYKWGDSLIAFSGTLSGGTDEYNRPSEINITNHRLHRTKTVKLDDGVLICNDDYKLGILDLIDKYNTLINENEISLMMATFNNRVQKIISASDDGTKESAIQYLKKVESGELAVIGESPFLEDLKVQGANISGNQSLASMIEYNQYLKASLLNELGIQANTNNKKERLITAEIEQDKELLYPLVNNMFYNRYQGIQELNVKYGLNVTVNYGSVWKDRDLEQGVNDETERVEKQGTDTEPTESDEPTES